MVAQILTVVFCVTLFTGCAGQAIQLPQSVQDPANPNARETVFSPRPNWLQSETFTKEEQPAIIPTPSTNLPTTGPAIFTCPMHPEVVQSSQGRCPDCGMKLVPKNQSENDSDD